jgi:Ring finger domain
MFPNRSPYRIGLFDDIHTYLPELLYNRGRFRNVQDVLDYVHDVASRQLNPWPTAVADYTARIVADDVVINPMTSQTPVYRRSGGGVGSNRRYPGTVSGGNRYNARTGATIPQQQQSQHQPQTHLHSRLHRTLPVYQNANYLNYYGYGGPAATATAATATTDTQDLLNLINAAFGIMPTTATQAAPRPAASWLDPVTVRPTNEQINAGSHTFMIADMSTEANERCAICQEDFISGAAVRRLNACRHLFHRNCIDRWFNSNVRCPVCRYDIRDPATTPQQQQETVSSYIQEATTPAETPTPTPTATALSDSSISDSTMSAAVEALMNLITSTGTTNAGDNITIRIEVDDIPQEENTQSDSE